MVFAGATLVWSFDAARARKWKPLALAALGAALVFAFSSWIPARIDRSGSQGSWMLGLAAESAGDDQRALELYDEAIALNARISYYHNSRGALLRKLGRLADAEQSLRTALDVPPENAFAEQSLIELLVQTERYPEAFARATAWVQRRPRLVEAHFSLGAAHFARAERLGAGADARSDLERASAAFQQALALGPVGEEGFRMAYSLGLVLRRLGHDAEALQAFEHALALKPANAIDAWFWNAQLARLELCVALGRKAEASMLARELVQRFPSEPPALELSRRFDTP
jgi:tetratricopeptide (TPR) repeat protein